LSRDARRCASRASSFELERSAGGHAQRAGVAAVERHAHGRGNGPSGRRHRGGAPLRGAPRARAREHRHPAPGGERATAAELHFPTVRAGAPAHRRRGDGLRPGGVTHPASSVPRRRRSRGTLPRPTRVARGHCPLSERRNRVPPRTRASAGRTTPSPPPRSRHDTGAQRLAAARGGRDRTGHLGARGRLRPSCATLSLT
jgi:hypothetical protein